MRKPNVIVYLDVTPEQSYERIKMRSRECESNLPLEYLIKLSRAYEDFLTDISQIIPVLRVDWSTFRTAEEMAVQIQQQYAAMRSIKRVDWDIAPIAPPAAPLPMTPPLATTKPRIDPDRYEDEGSASEVGRALEAVSMESVLVSSPQATLSAESPN